MRKIILLMAMLFCAYSYGQLKKVELTQDEINFIGVSKGSFLGKISDEDFDKLVSLNKTPIVFEFLFKDKIIYVGTINKWGYNYSASSEIGRTRVDFCFNYSDLDSETVMELLENSRWEAEKTATSKYICRRDFEIFSYDGNKKKVIVNDVIKDKIKVKLYKIVELNL